MLISRINFTSSNFDNFSLKKPAQNTHSATQPDSTQINQTTQDEKRNNLKKYTLIGAGILLAAILAFKGKSILNKFRKKAEIPEIKPQQPEVKPTPVEPVKPQTVEVIENATKPNRYALIDEYDRRTKARVEFRNRTRGRALTPDEKIERDRLRQEWSEIYHRLIPEHQSIIRTKTAADFANETEKQNYIMNYVLPRMDMSEESALDALDMFEQFGFRADYPRNDIIIDTTMTKLGSGIYTIPKECRSDKLLRRFIDVFAKFADNKIRRHPDDDELAAVLTSFVKKGHDIQEDTVLRGIELMKKIICQKANHERLESALVSSFDAKFKDSQPIKDALEELKVIVKDMQYRLRADDK